MITSLPEGGLKFEMKLEETLLMKLPHEVMAIASAQLAADIVEHFGKKILEEMDAEELTRQVHRKVIDELAAGFQITVKQPSIEPVSEVVKENKETATDEFRRSRGAKI